MRLGQILLETEQLTQEQVSEGLDYGGSKGIFLGRALELLKHVSDADIARALRAQQLIRLGLSPVLAIEALKTSIKEAIPLEQALQDKWQGAALESSMESSQDDSALELDQSDTPEALIKNGDLLLIHDRCSDAEEQYRKAREALELALGKDHIDLAPVLMRLGNTYLALHSFDKAKECYELVLEIRIKSLSPTHPLVAKAHESLADLYKALGESSKYVDESSKALDILEKNLPSQLSAYAGILKKLAAWSAINHEQSNNPLPVGELLKRSGILSEQELNTALRMAKQTSQPVGLVLRDNCMIGDRELQSALKAQFCVKHGVLSEQLAVDLLSRAARRNISLERLLHEAGVLASEEGKLGLYRQIAADLDLLVSAESSAVSQDQKEMAPIAYRLGTLYEQVGDKPQAEIYYSRALKIWGSSIQGDLVAAQACSSLAKIFQSSNRQDEAVPLLLKALEHRQQVLGKTHEETIQTLEDLAEMELESRDSRAALAHAQQALESREQLGQGSMELFRAVIVSGDCHVLLKNYESAQAAYNRAMALSQSGADKPTLALAAVMEKLGDMYVKQGMTKVATPLYKSALMILENAGMQDGKGFETLQKKIELD